MTHPKNQTSKHLFQEQAALLVTTRVKILLTFLVALVLALLAVFIARQQYTGSLSQRSDTIAALLDPARVHSLVSPDPNTAKNEAYLENRLQQASGANGDVRSLKLLGLSTANKVYVLADSLPASSADHSARGTIYNEASQSLQASFYINKSFVEGPVKDRWGEWIMAVSPVYDSTGQQVAMLAVSSPTSAYFTVIALAAAIPLAGAVLTAIVFLTTDTIRRRRQESVRMRSELVSIASHELRTPLTGIRWGEESLLSSDISAPTRNILQTMYDSTIRLQESIEDILQLANWQAGRKQELVYTSTDIGQMLTGIFATQKLPAAQKNITLEFAKDWPKQLIINCDAQRMKRVFNNLVSNAIKYSKPGTAVVIAHEMVEGKHLLTITDHGIGIPASEQRKVFAGFYRASNAIKHETNGTGMGLYMSRNAVEQHSGKLWLTSTEGKGTTAYVQLP